MAKPLTVEFQGQTVEFALEKVDRTKLYGYVETEVHDEAGNRCELRTLAGDGHSVIGKGGAVIKEAGTAARQELEALLGTRVHLETLVKVDKDWQRRPDRLDRLGL